ncbi:putative NAD -binding protein [Rosellinia necatrix]|uniref:Putative NAD-binding protein n=1 Tax=Rosellinia necatrix TaxID=77044 RepID=A0A1W2TH38_ROSNE|nr:putative NAD -binding protein [Rosellinia necatrix]
MAKVILTKGYVPIIGTGLARMGNVHIQDLTQAYVLLVEAALAGDASPELWGARGYHLTVTGEHTWGPLARAMAAEARAMGLLKGGKAGQEGEGEEEEPLEEHLMSREEALETAGFEALSWGLNARCKGLRLAKFLGWKAEHPSLEDEIPGIVKSEAKRLGLL